MMFKIVAFLSPLNRNIEKRAYCFLLPTFPPQPTARRLLFLASGRKNTSTSTSRPFHSCLKRKLVQSLKSCLTLCDPMNCSTSLNCQTSLNFTVSWSLLKVMSTESVRRKLAGANPKGWGLIHIESLLNDYLIYSQRSPLFHVLSHSGNHTLSIGVPIGGRPSNTCALYPAFWSAM